MTNSKNDVLLYELNNPKAGNAFGVAQAEEVIALLSKAFRSPKSKSSRKDQASNNARPGAFIFRSSGRLFCAGGNLSDYAAMKTPAAGKAANRTISRALKMIHDLPVPTLCLVQGDCWGGGVEVMSAFDHVIAAPEASFGFWQRRIGLTFGWGGGTRLLKRVSPSKLLDLSLQTRAIGAHEALRAGLVDEVVLRAQFAKATVAWLVRIQENSQLPTPVLKSMLSKITLSEKLEASVFQKLWWNRDHLAILKARK